MKVLHLSQLLLLLILLISKASGDLPNETWGYVEITPTSHMFYWFYGCLSAPPPERVHLPIVMWTNGGPGGSSFNGDFMEIGPFDVEGKPRNYTWANDVNLLFVDQPVGTGYSYVEQDSDYVTTKEQINEHLLLLLQTLVVRHPEMKRAPFYLFGQSYGGKVMADFGVHLSKAITEGEIALDLRGVGLGDPWIYPLGMVSTYGPWLLSLSQLDASEVSQVDAFAKQMEEALRNGENQKATTLWGLQQSLIVEMTGGVDFYDYTAHNKPADNRLQEKMDSEETRSKYGIPDNVKWGSQRPTVFEKLENEFMLDCLESIDYLLNETSVEVNIYNGSFDLIVDTPGVKLAVSKLQWAGLRTWNNSPKKNFVIEGQMKGNSKCHGGLCTYYLLNSGHSAPADNPDMGVAMLRDIIQRGK